MVGIFSPYMGFFVYVCGRGGLFLVIEDSFLGQAPLITITSAGVHGGGGGLESVGGLTL